MITINVTLKIYLAVLISNAKYTSKENQHLLVIVISLFFLLSLARCFFLYISCILGGTFILLMIFISYKKTDGLQEIMSSCTVELYIFHCFCLVLLLCGL
jgi:hypothetical protein